MTRIITLLIAALFLIQQGEAQITGKVIGIADGDTFTLLTKDNKQVKIRLHGIDCPEKKQDYGTVAKQFVSDLIFGKVLTVQQTDIDRYGRIIAIVPINGTTLNEMLLRNGLAWHYCKYDKNDYWHTLQDSAKMAKAGAWVKPDIIEPWIFRKLK